MVWQRMIERLTRRNRRFPQQSATGRKRRSLRHESLAKRYLLASDIGAITGVAFTDQTGNGLTADDQRLENVTVQLFRDTNNSGTFENGTDVLVDTDSTDTAADPVPGQYRFDNLSVDTYFVVQSAAGGSATAPAPQTVTIGTDDADGATIVTIDDFTTGAQAFLATGGQTQTSSAVAANALGGSRDVQLEHTNGSGNTSFQVDTGTELLSLSTGGGGTGQAIVEYDGADNTFALNVPPGFSPIASLSGGTAGGIVPTNTGLEIVGRAENQDETMIITVFTSATEASEISINIPQNAALQTVFLEFDNAGWGTSTSAGITAGADFNSIIAIRAQATVTLADNDIFFSVVESRGPDPQTVNLANTQLLTLGGTVFQDFGGGTDTNDGMLDAGETLLGGVDIQLFAEPGGGGAIDPSTQTAVDTTTTDASGDYSFTGLDAGNYLVVIPESEFANGQPLFGHLTSTGNDPAPDPDDNADGDDNGSLLAGVGLVTGEITLAVGDEPINDGDNDTNTNFSLDFGVIPTIDLEITKTLDAANSTLQSGGTAVFTLDFDNNGPLDATNVVITDTIPAGLTIDQANSNFGAFTPTINGQNISVAIGNLAVNTPGSITIATTVDNGQTADLTNTAEIQGDEVETVEANNTDDALVDLTNADLAIAKVDDVATSAATGEQYTYTLTVTNNGPDAASGVQITDNLPAGVSFVSDSFPSGATTGSVTESPAGSGQLVIAFANDLASTASESVEITVSVDADAPDSIVNTATVVGTPDVDNVPGNNSATETTPIVRSVDVGIVKSTTDTAVAGGTLTYSIEVSNTGISDARGVVVTDTLDPNLTLVANSFDAGTSGVTLSTNGQTLTFDVPDLEAEDPNDGDSETLTFTFQVQIGSDAANNLDPDEIVNTASITTTDEDPTTAGENPDSSTVTTPLTVDTDLTLTKAVDLATAVPGQDTLQYSFTIAHDSNSVSDSGEITFTDTLPDGLTGVSINDLPNNITRSFDSTNQVVTVVVPSLGVNETLTFTVDASVNANAIEEDRVADNATTGDRILENDAAIVFGGQTVTSNEVTTTLNPDVQLTIDKTVNDTTPDAGSNVTYSIAIGNTGDSTATNVILTDDIPADLTFVSGTLDGQAATSDGTTITFPAVTLDPNATALVASLVFTVDVDAEGVRRNTASVTSDEDGPETDFVDITTDRQADLTVTKTVDESAAAAGDALVYTVTVTNSGVSTADAATAVDTLPAGVSFVSGTGPNNTALTDVNGVITVNGGDLAPGANFSFTINATIEAATSGTVTNNVSVSTTTTEVSTTNNDASANTVVDPMLSTISGSVYVDADDDGIRDAGETPIPGVSVRLTGTDSLGNVVDRTEVTDADGNYSFDALAAGTYRVEETQPANFTNGQTTAGTGATATAADNVFTNLDLGTDADAINFNFGELAERLSKRRFLASSNE